MENVDWVNLSIDAVGGLVKKVDEPSGFISNAMHSCETARFSRIAGWLVG